MKVQSLMTQGVHTCQPDSNLGDAARKMFEGDCGLLPVLENGRLCGVITDRDICMAGMIRGQPVTNIQVRDVMSGNHYTCRSDQDLQSALLTMANHQVRRLPVVGRDGELEGLLSLNDLISESKASRNKTGAPTYKDIIVALQAIGRHHDLPTVG